MRWKTFSKLLRIEPTFRRMQLKQKTKVDLPSGDPFCKRIFYVFLAFQFKRGRFHMRAHLELGSWYTVSTIASMLSHRPPSWWRALQRGRTIGEWWRSTVQVSTHQWSHQPTRSLTKLPIATRSPTKIEEAKLHCLKERGRRWAGFLAFHCIQKASGELHDFYIYIYML